MKKLRWGVIGAGGIADRRTIPGLMQAKNAELTSVMEIEEALAERLKEKYGAKRAYVDSKKLLDDPEVDAVYIASPVSMHVKQAMEAADAGKHILIEKPLALSSEEGEKVLEYCERKGIKIAAGFMMRFGTHVQAMKKAVSEGLIGDVVSGYAQFTCWYPEIAGAWRQSKANAGGGALMDMGIHCVDLIQYITNSRVKQVAALHDTLTFSYDVEDTSSVILRLDNGAQCVIQSNFNIPDEVAKWRLEFFGTRGRLLGDAVIGQIDGGEVDAMFLEGVDEYNAYQDKVDSGPSTWNEDVEFGNMYTREIESFSDSVLNGTPLEVPASEAVQVQKVIEAAYQSNYQMIIIEL